MKNAVKVPPAITHAGRHIEANKIKKRLFIYPSSKADERYLKSKIGEYVIQQLQKPFDDYLLHHVWKVNGEGKTIKYCFYSERLGRVFLTRDFEQWARYTRDEIIKLLNKVA